MGNWFSLETITVATMLAAALALIFKAYLEGRRALQERDMLLKGQRSELERLAMALNQHALVTVTNAEGRITEVNQRFLDTFGYAEDELIGRPHRDFYVGESREKSDEIAAKTRAGQLWSGETQMRRADGSIALTQCTAVPMLENGAHVKTITFRSDVTELRQSEAEHLMTVGFDNLSAAVYIFDPKTYHICYMNAHALAEQGWSAPDFRQRTIWDADYEPDPEVFETAVQGLKEGTRATLPLSRPHQDRHYEAQLYTISNKCASHRVLAIVQDVSERVEAQRKQQEIVSVIAHELRTPLTSIKGAVKLLRAGSAGEIPAKAGSLLEIAENNSARMLLLIKDLLELEKIEQANFTLELTPVDTARLIEEAILNHRSYGLELGVQFVKSGTDTPLVVAGDADRLMQVMSNLMSNAAKFSKFGDQVEVGVQEDSTHVVLFVRDHGAGIPEAARATLFDRFTQAHGKDAVKVDSSGLGLSIVKSLVEKHGGTVDFDSELGKGTTFRVRLPKISPQMDDKPALKVAAA